VAAEQPNMNVGEMYDCFDFLKRNIYNHLYTYFM